MHLRIGYVRIGDRRQFAVYPFGLRRWHWSFGVGRRLEIPPR